MFEHLVGAAAGPIIAQSREKVYAAQAPQMIAQRELELLLAAERTPRQSGYGVRRILARLSARLAGGTVKPVVTGQ